jgi:hypothetical protein
VYFAAALHQETGAGNAIYKGKWIDSRSFEKSSHILVESPGKSSFWGTFKPDLSGTPFFQNALCLNVFIPSVL